MNNTAVRHPLPKIHSEDSDYDYVLSCPIAHENFILKISCWMCSDKKPTRDEIDNFLKKYLIR